MEWFDFAAIAAGPRYLSPGLGGRVRGAATPQNRTLHGRTNPHWFANPGRHPLSRWHFSIFTQRKMLRQT